MLFPFSACNSYYSLSRAKMHRKFTGKIRSATISQVLSGKYYVSVLVETEHEELQHTDKNIGLDLGIKDLCITSGLMAVMLTFVFRIACVFLKKFLIGCIHIVNGICQNIM